MTSSSKYILFFLISLFILTLNSNAQRRRKPKIWEGTTVGARGGVNMFYGDLVDQSKTSYSAGAVFEKELSTYLSGRLQLNLGQMKGEQLYGDGEGLYAYFKNYYTEISVGATFKPLSMMLGYFKQRSFKPYIIGQLGIVYYNTKEWYGEYGYIPNSLRHQLSGISPIVTGGFGVSYWINSRISANIEYTGTLPFTDLLDGHENWVTGVDEIRVYETDANDFYYTAMVGITFLIDDSRWKNEPKYNRKAYLKTRKQYSRSSKASRSNVKSIQRKRRRR